MADHTIRELRGLEDARPQYELWLRATAPLPRAWRSCLRNVEHQLQNGLRYPKCRLYAERPGGRLIGYIGTHPPFEWVASEHGPPAQSLGWVIPFGYPWTHPHDEALEATLYDEMFRITPEVYADSQRDIYIQRFRESWSQHLSFLEQRGWRRHARLPLLSRDVDDAGKPPSELVVIARDDLPLVSTLSQEDDTAVDKLTPEDLRQRYDGGWIVSDTFWRLGERGAFAIEQRGPWAAVTLLLARPNAWDETLRAAAAQARTMGAGEIYFTIDAHETRRREALDSRGFREVDAGVYYIRDAD
jgi:hypothetical protein